VLDGGPRPGADAHERGEALGASACGERGRKLPARGPPKQVRMASRESTIGIRSLHAFKTRGTDPIFPLVRTSGFMLSMSLSALGDAELVALCRAGDQDAWRELVSRFSRYVYAIATQAFRLGPEDAEDVFQEVFARTYERLDRLRDDAAIRPWIAQLTRRLAIDRIRASSRVELPGDDLEPPDVDETLATLDEALDVRKGLAQLPEHCQEVLDRFFARDESYETIGSELEIPSGTIASRISRCLSKLREQLEGRSASSPASGERVIT
jgi:RNA polymerase sigma-70 factor (ECF subfamily)